MFSPHRFLLTLLAMSQNIILALLLVSMIDVTVNVQVSERPMKRTPCEGVHCGCQKGYCWSWCHVGWCYTNGRLSLNFGDT